MASATFERLMSAATVEDCSVAAVFLQIVSTEIVRDLDMFAVARLAVGIEAGSREFLSRMHSRMSIDTRNRLPYCHICKSSTCSRLFR